MLPPSVCSPNSTANWRVKRRAAREYRRQAALAAMTVRNDRGETPELPHEVTMDVVVAWDGRRQEMDSDNCWAAIKACRDGIADVLLDGDDRGVTLGTLTQIRGNGTTTVTLRGVR